MKRSPFPSPSAGPAPAEQWSLGLWGLLVVLAGNMLIDALEVSVAIVALPSIGRDLRLPLVSAQWVMTGFAIGFGGLMLFGVRVVALLGRRPVYLAAMFAFAVASIVGALAGGPGLLVATRIIKGFCAALTAPTGLAIIATAFPAGPSRNRALSVYTLFGASGFTVGLLLSGALTEIGWRLTFAFPAPVVLVLACFGWRLIPASAPRGRRPASGTGPRRYDLAGATAFTGGLMALVFGITSVSRYGWADSRSWGTLVSAALLLGAFAVIERRIQEPLVRMQLLADRTLLRSALGAAALNGSYLGLLFTLTYELQTLAGWSPLRTALAFLPAAAPLAVTALLSGRIVAAFGAPRLIALGMLFPLAGYLLQLRQSWPLGYVSGVLPTMLLIGVGFVLCFAALNLQATAGFPPEDRGAAGGLYQTAVQVGAVVELTLVAPLLAGAHSATASPPAQALEAFRPALLLVAATGVLGLLVGLDGVLRRGGPDEHAPPGPPDRVSVDPPRIVRGTG